MIALLCAALLTAPSSAAHVANEDYNEGPTHGWSEYQVPLFALHLLLSMLCMVLFNANMRCVYTALDHASFASAE